MDYGGLIRAHINHTSTYTEEVEGIIGYGGTKGLGWRARLVVYTARLDSRHSLDLSQFIRAV